MYVLVPPVIMSVCVCLSVCVITKQKIDFVCLSVLSLSKKLTRQEDQKHFFTLLGVMKKFVGLLLRKFVKSVLYM